jgi:8-oxo-dGTP pyrophosphatase MutT (NUDIX family)
METPTETNIDEVHIARTVILDQDDCLLVLWRADDDDYNPGGPDLPGGGIESDETPRTAAKRELLEESGIVLADDALREIYTSVQETSEGDRKKRLIRTFFAACVENPKVKLKPDEHKEFDWLPLDEAREVFVYSATKLRCLERIVELRASGELAAA